MKITWSTPKNVSDATRIQRELRASIRIQPMDSPIRRIAGADISFDRGSDWFHAAWVVLDAESLQVVEESAARVKSTFPYVPGYLSFREIPALLEAYSKLKQAPDVIVVDGQGIAHPRHLGIATHLGLVLDVPTLGCGKSRLYGRYSDPGPKPGDRSPILDPRTGERLGTAYRSRARSLPLILSPGHRTDIEDSVRIVESCLRGYRLPEPTRLAHFAANRLRREAQGSQAA